MIKFHGYVGRSVWSGSRGEYVGTFGVLKYGRWIMNDSDSCLDESGERKITIKVPKGLDNRTMYEVVNNQMRESCNCEHDCCGHWQTHVRNIKHTKRQEYIVTLYSYRNY